MTAQAYFTVALSVLDGLEHPEWVIKDMQEKIGSYLKDWSMFDVIVIPGTQSLNQTDADNSKIILRKVKTCYFGQRSINKDISELLFDIGVKKMPAKGCLLQALRQMLQ
ncbi:MAG: hypothetical protein ACOCVN_03145 [bacterium]